MIILKSIYACLQMQKLLVQPIMIQILKEFSDIPIIQLRTRQLHNQIEPKCTQMIIINLSIHQWPNKQAFREYTLLGFHQIDKYDYIKQVISKTFYTPPLNRLNRMQIGNPIRLVYNNNENYQIYLVIKYFRVYINAKLNGYKRHISIYKMFPLNKMVETV
ncbi:unnamed protein product [Paramecium pentaurelia]|uniref:Uncharacterized protein n=1 Tax=Paramecium pentaurelia TaxID=43138 RepID=A0A8S1VC71_9CILI|nr:unnamed protein product [Paramecium pentaurelia]